MPRWARPDRRAREPRTNICRTDVPDPAHGARKGRTVRRMWTVLLILLVAWVVLSVVGFAFEGLLWLAIIGIVLFVGTLIFGIIRQRARRNRA